jgi:hypothetical protein
MNAKELVASAIENATARYAKAQSAHKAWLEQLAFEAVGRIDDSLPDSLRPYVVYAGEYPDNEQTRTAWKPSFFKIEAPNLLPMAFTTRVVNEALRVHSIRVGIVKYGTDWAAAIEAAEIKEEVHGQF